VCGCACGRHPACDTQCLRHPCVWAACAARVPTSAVCPLSILNNNSTLYPETLEPVNPETLEPSKLYFTQVGQLLVQMSTAHLDSLPPRQTNCLQTLKHLPTLKPSKPYFTCTQMWASCSFRCRQQTSTACPRAKQTACKPSNPQNPTSHRWASWSSRCRRRTWTHTHRATGVDQ
jgi:hypothetical protein